jgi:hypothetical protein
VVESDQSPAAVFAAGRLAFAKGPLLEVLGGRLPQA